ncbi:epithelial cell-transforming sequence 2 oncogene-like isoform X6 [Choloepus didactylus]|uniref:epithelial cell-transforming sequence 2 oncogene-like isoform X6 n=1 Tax=Choloepus didactylus TaxID=27675 RepID=UPI0018A0F7A9|nr:epithelial cell-transforming sequence 2 oncogene-like isoform X6 [Choloepus didactylus]
MSVEDSSQETLEMESFHTRLSAWTPFSNKSLNRQLFQERVALISHWFDLWTNKQRQEFLRTIFLRCAKSQLRFVQDWFSERKQVAKADFSTVLPRFISLYIFSFLNPKDLCAAAQVSWPWKFLTEQDCLWRPKCVKFGWFLPYTPTENEFGAWKHHYLSCVSHLDWLTPREAAGVYGTLNEPKEENEELQERRREKCLRKVIWEKIALRNSCSIGLSNVLRPEVRGFWETLGSSVAPADEGGHVDLFAPLAASEAGMEVLSQLSQLTGTLFTAPTGTAAGSYHHILSDWLGPPPGGPPPAVYFCEPKLQAWCRFTDSLEDALAAARRQLRPLFQELQEEVSGRLIGQFVSDNMSVARILENQETAQALADGLTELSRENCDNPLEFLSSFLLKKCSEKSKEVEGNGLPAKCGSKAASIAKEGRVTEDSSQDTTLSLRSKGPNVEELVALERRLREDPAAGRARVVAELLASERRYVRALETVRAVYARPLAAALASNRAVLSAASADVVFADVLRILSLNRQFLAHLGERLRGWGPAHCVGDIVIKFGSRLDVYTNFFNNYPAILKTIERCREMIPAFRAFLKRRDRTVVTQMLSLQELLLCPSRRFGEYLHLLYALRLHTPAEHADRGDLTTAIEQIKNYKGYIEQMKQNFLRKDQLSDIQRSICGCPTLSEVNRYLIRIQDVAQLHCCDEEISLSLRLYEHIRDLSLFLFNDALLVSSRAMSHTPFTRTSKTTHQFIASVALHRLLIEDIPDSKYIKNAFILHGPKHEWICATETEDDKFLWLSVLQSAIKSSTET